MEPSAPCPYRYIHKGRTFCAIAIRDRRYTTSEVLPTVCRTCKARQVLQTVQCGNLELGVEVDQYGGSLDVEIFYVSCRRLVERLLDFSQCNKERCSYWVPTDEERFAEVREEALRAQREHERKAAE